MKSILTKKCKACSQTKTTDLFYRHKFNLDGLMGKCIDCFNKANKLYYIEHKCTPEQRMRQRERSRIYREKTNQK